MMNFSPDFEAEVTFLTNGEGGRTGPVSSTYRPQLHYPSPSSNWIIMFEWAGLQSGAGVFV